MSAIILLQGHTASGKSTLARHLGQILVGAKTIHSAVVRKALGLSPGEGDTPDYRFDLADDYFVQVVSKQVYRRMGEIAEAVVVDGGYPILDAAYNFRTQRRPVYALGGQLGVPVIGILCLCNNQAEVKRRLGERLGKQGDPFSEAPAWSTYLSTIELAESLLLDHDEKPGPACLLRYDSGKMQIETNNRDLPVLIARALELSLERIANERE